MSKNKNEKYRPRVKLPDKPARGVLFWNNHVSYILKTVRPENLQNWIKTNAVGSLKGVPADSWRAYLAANGGTGKTISDLEASFCIAAGAVGKTLHDLWADYLGRVIGQAGTKGKEKARNRYK